MSNDISMKARCLNSDNVECLTVHQIRNLLVTYQTFLVDIAQLSENTSPFSVVNDPETRRVIQAKAQQTLSHIQTILKK